ncbi:MAG TPA: nickel pincer cofactor biosynthesis protein LarB [Gemmatimonadales bacterium]|nr:nickel pincer cofactor biosynthesis protein LarB [Gemmatimonadales bacterium]
MTPEHLEALLADVAAGRLAPAAAAERLGRFPSERLDFATLDHHRALRQGHPEVVFCAGKTDEQVLAICERLAAEDGGFFGTRASARQAELLAGRFPRLEWNALGRTVRLAPEPAPPLLSDDVALVVCAGTSDLPVAEECAATLAAFRHRVERLTDVGVAGLHRLLAEGDRLRDAAVVIVAAGMEGALPSVVGGLVAVPVIAVPTSVGYGASFGGLAALLGMLNSCASGLTVVNIDNGFGAAVAASRILRQRLRRRG